MQIRRKTCLSIGLVLSLGSLPPVADAALLSRLGGLAVYDTDRDLTWVADANLPATHAFGVPFIAADGTVDSYEVLSWFEGMNADGGTGYLGFNNWRLPDGGQIDIAQTELGHLFLAELGGTPGGSIADSSDPDLQLFKNIQTDRPYWIDAKDGDPETRFDHWVFSFDTGAAYLDGYTEGEVGYMMWPVRDGDVLKTPVPQSAILFGAGLLGLVAVSRRRTHR